MPDTPEPPGPAASGEPATGEGTHDDDELAAALAAQLEHYTRTGSVPVSSAARGAPDENPRGAAANPPPAPVQPAAAPATAPPRRPEQPRLPVPGAHRRTEPVTRRSYTGPIPLRPPADTGPVRPLTGPVRQPGGTRRVPPSSGSDPAPPETPAAAPGVASPPGYAGIAGLPRDAEPGRRSTFRTGELPIQRPRRPEQPRPEPATTQTRFPSPVPHFSPISPREAQPSEPIAGPQPPSSPPPAPDGPAPVTAAPAADPGLPGGAGEGSLARLQALQARLASVRLDDATYREWAESLRHLGGGADSAGAHAASSAASGTPSPATEPRFDPAPFPPIVPPGTHEPAFAPPPEASSPPAAPAPVFLTQPTGFAPSEGGPPAPAPAEPDLIAVPVDVSPASHAEVIDAELVDDTELVADDARPPAGDVTATGSLIVQPGPMPATASAAFLTAAPATPGEPGGIEQPPVAEVAPLVEDAINPLTLDEGVLSTGSLPVITSALDRDFDDDIDDYAPAADPPAADSTAILAAPPPGTAGSPKSAGGSPTGVLPNAAALSAGDPKLPSAFLLEPAGLHPSPVDRRLRRPVAQFWLWFAPNTSALTVAVGAALIGLGLSLRQSLVAAVLGVMLACIPLGANVLAVKRSGQPAAVVSRASFGLVGNLVPTVLLLLLRVSWAAVLTWLIGGTAGRLVALAGWSQAIDPLLIEIIAIVVISAVASVIAVFGHGLLAAVHLLLSGVSLLVVGAAVLFSATAVDLPAALARPDGSLLAVIGGMVGVFSLLAVAWTSIGGELARYQQPSSSSAQTIAFAAYGAAVPALLLIGWGALLAGSSPRLGDTLRADPIEALAGLLPDWYLAPLLLTLVLGLVAALATVLYSTGLTFPAAGVPLDRRFTTVLTAVLGGGAAVALVAATPDVGQLLTDLVPVAAVPVAAWTGIIATELFLRTRPLSASDLAQRGGRYPDLRWPNLAMLAGATVVGIGLLGSGPYAPFAGWLWALLGLDGAAPLPQADLGVVVALLAGLLAPAVTGRAALRRQEGRAA